MSLKEFVSRRVHGLLCRPEAIPQVDWGCCGCGAAEMDAYITAGSATCGAPGEGYCWACLVDFPWPFGHTMADFTVLPGREPTS